MENLHQSIRDKLDFFHQTNQIPHIIFHGESGTGKKTLVYEFLEKIYDNNKQKIKNNVMVVNCSHGKGIKFIRDDLKFFAKTNIQSNYGVNFKSIVLFNADNLTTDAQSALRRCIELFSYNTRFFIIVEKKHKLLNPILSRFCEIYVPEYINDHGVIENLHKYHLTRKFKNETLETAKKTYLFHLLNYLYKNCETINHKTLCNISLEIYEKGYSCLDIMDILKTNTELPWNREQVSAFSIQFHKIKSEFRCEKLLIFYMLMMIFFEK
jgi:hypothetical protein